MKTRAIAFWFIVALFAGFWGVVWLLMSPYPKGDGVLAVSPNGCFEAVLLPIETVETSDTLRYMLNREEESMRVSRHLRLAVIQGKFGTPGGIEISSTELPFRHCPQLPLNKREIFRWQPDSRACTFVLRGTNLVLTVPFKDPS